jgi:DNA mismatch repair protein MutS
MSFEMDQETFMDLEIFTERAGRKNIFSIFNSTRTEGGRLLLKDMMKRPVSDRQELIFRCDLIRFLHQQHPELDITYNQLDMIEHYLRFNKKLLKNNIVDALWDHWSNKYRMSNDYYIVKAGISAFIRLLRTVAGLLVQIRQLPGHESLSGPLQSIQQILDLNDFQKFLFRDEPVSCFELNRLDRSIRVKQRDSVRKLLDFIYQFDVFEAVAGKLDASGWILPEYQEIGSADLYIEGLCHPSILHAVENDACLDSETSVLFLTGPNMGGKSSFLKSAGLAVYLAHIGFPVPARKMITPVFKGLITTVNLPDNIHEGLSHYLSEVRRVKETMLKLLDHGPMFVVFDELFRGTNFRDAYEASLSIISGLSQSRTSKFLISSHITELADELQKLSRVRFSYFESFLEGERAVFTYKMRTGVSKDRFGMYIIKNEGIPGILERIGHER